jgi:hypothetical protein
MAERVGSVRWSEVESTTLVASKSPYWQWQALTCAGPLLCFAPPASPARSHVGAPYQGAGEWRDSLKQLVEQACWSDGVHPLGWHVALQVAAAAGHESMRSDRESLSRSALRSTTCYACMTACAATAPAANLVHRGLPGSHARQGRAPPAHSESGEECGPLSDAAPNSFELARVFLAAGGSVPERFRRLKIPRPHAAGDTKSVACRYVQRACEHSIKLLSTHGCLDLNVVFAAVV